MSASIIETKRNTYRKGDDVNRYDFQVHAWQGLSKDWCERGEVKSGYGILRTGSDFSSEPRLDRPGEKLFFFPAESVSSAITADFRESERAEQAMAGISLPTSNSGVCCSV